MGGQIFLSLAKQNGILVLDAKTGGFVKTISVPAPGRMKAAADGRLLVVSGGTSVLSVDPATGTERSLDLGPDGCDRRGRGRAGPVYVGVGDPDNQVRVYDGGGQVPPRHRPVRRAGAAGPVAAGRPALHQRPDRGPGRQALGGRERRLPQARLRLGHGDGPVRQGVLRLHPLRRTRRGDQPARPERHGRLRLRVAAGPADGPRPLRRRHHAGRHE